MGYIFDWNEKTATRRVFFFQAEDGIRDADVTGVQTCALPISCHDLLPVSSMYSPASTITRLLSTGPLVREAESFDGSTTYRDVSAFAAPRAANSTREIGRSKRSAKASPSDGPTPTTPRPPLR